MYRRIVTLALVLTAFGTVPARAQIAEPSPSISIHRGLFQFDLSGTGSTRLFALRGDLPISSLVLLEAGVSYAEPKQQFEESTKHVIPEMQAQLQWPLGPVAPYLGAGGGAALDFRSEEWGGTQANVTLSGAGGVRVRVAEHLALRGELRVRGIGTRFQASTSEWTVGAAWHP